MTFLGRNRIAWPVVVVILLLALGLLVRLQYQWTKQASDATRAHVGAELRRAILAWHLDLFRSLAGAPVSLRLNSEAANHQSRKSYVARYREWRARAAHPGIVSNMYIWTGSGDRHSQMLRLNPATGGFEPEPWPEKFERLRQRLRTRSSFLALAVAGASSPEEFFSDHPEEDRPFQIGKSGTDALGGWVFEPEIPALFHPIAHEDATATEPKGTKHSADWIVIEYSTDVLRKELLPELAQRYFSGRERLEYDVAVVAGIDQSSMIYCSAPASETTKIDQPDATLNLFGPTRGASLGSPISFSQNQQSELDDYGPSANRNSYDFRGAFWFPVIHAGPTEQDWYLLVKHRQGSLDELFARAQRRNLTISFGILLLLVLSIGLVLVASQRAQSLAKLQVDFVAGVSHDLRTPLAIIGLAADNLADGVIHGQQAVVKYGTTLQAQVRELAERVEQVLLFAATDRNKATYCIRSIQVNEVIDTALRNTSIPIEAAGVVVDLSIEPGLPPVLTDSAALTQALQNVIANGVKYGGEDRWLGIRARTAGVGKHGTEIQVSIEDHGIGIERSELHRVLEPFYRSPAVIAKGIRGTGLGLTLAKSSVEAVGGSISISSFPGRGSTFVLHLPSAERKTDDSHIGVCASS